MWKQSLACNWVVYLLRSINFTSVHLCRSDIIWRIQYYSKMLVITKIRVKVYCIYLTRRASSTFPILSIVKSAFGLRNLPDKDLNISLLRLRHFHKLLYIDINYRLPIKVYYRICTLRHIRIEINHGSQNVFCLLTWIGGY